MGRKRIDYSKAARIDGVPSYPSPSSPTGWRPLSKKRIGAYNQYLDQLEVTDKITGERDDSDLRTKSKPKKKAVKKSIRRPKGGVFRLFNKSLNLDMRALRPIRNVGKGIKFTTQRYYKFGAEFDKGIKDIVKHNELYVRQDTHGAGRDRGGVNDGKDVRKWGVNREKGDGKKYGGSHILRGGSEFAKHLQIAAYKVLINQDKFRKVILYRAYTVFKTSFSRKQFYSRDAQAWAPLKPYTLRKRARRGTGARILHEYGDLKNSLELQDKDYKITTKEVPANKKKHKSRTLCYAGWHNEGEGHYGFRDKKMSMPNRHYTQRQFMGHSTHLSPITDTFIAKVVKAYFFDEIFLTRLAGTR